MHPLSFLSKGENFAFSLNLNTFVCIVDWFSNTKRIKDE